MFYTGKEKRIEILIDDLNELVRKGCAMWLKLGEYEFALDKLSKCPTTTWYGIHQMLYSLEPWGVIKESKKSARKSLKEDSLDDIIPMGHSEYFDTLIEFLKDEDVPFRISHTVDGGKICYVENDMDCISVIFKSPKSGYELLKMIELWNDGSVFLSRRRGGAWFFKHVSLEEVYIWDMDKEWFLESLANPWIFNSVAEFQSSVQDGGIIEYDGCGNLLFINKKTLKLEEGDDCFHDGIDLWKIAEDEDHFGVPDETIERIINHFSDDKRQLIGVLWYNK